MKIKGWYIHNMLVVVFCVCVMSVILTIAYVAQNHTGSSTAISTADVQKHLLGKLQESSYAEAQFDALKNDIRVKLVNDSCVVYVKSPWRTNPNIPKGEYCFNK